MKIDLTYAEEAGEIYPTILLIPETTAETDMLHLMWGYEELAVTSPVWKKLNEQQN